MGCYNNKNYSKGEQIILSVLCDMKLMFFDFNIFYEMIFKEKYNGKISGSKTIPIDEFLNIVNQNLKGEEVVYENKLKGVQNYIFDQVVSNCLANDNEKGVLCIELLYYFLPLLFLSDHEKIEVFLQMCLAQIKVENYFIKNNEIYSLVRKYLESTLIFYTKCVYKFIIDKKINIEEALEKDIIRILWLCNSKNIKQFMKESLSVTFNLKSSGITQLETLRIILQQNSFIFNYYRLRETYYTTFIEYPTEILKSKSLDLSILNDQ